MKNTYLKTLAALVTFTACTITQAATVSHCRYSTADNALKCGMTATEMSQGAWKQDVYRANKKHQLNPSHSAFYVYFNYQLTPDDENDPNHVDYNDVKNILIQLHTNRGIVTCRTDQVIIGECYGYGMLNKISFVNASSSLLNKLPMAFNIG